MYHLIDRGLVQDIGGAGSAGGETGENLGVLSNGAVIFACWDDGARRFQCAKAARVEISDSRAVCAEISARRRSSGDFKR